MSGPIILDKAGGGTVAASADADGNLKVNVVVGGGGGGGGGDASAANQVTGNNTLASILAKILSAPATEAKQDTGNTSLASILAKIIAAPATEAKQDTGNTSLGTVATNTGTTATNTGTVATNTTSIDGKLPAAAALSDAFPQPATTTQVGALQMLWDSAAGKWMRRVGIIPADGVANDQVAEVVRSRLVGFNGTTWDRVRTGIIGKVLSATGVTGVLNVIGLGRYNVTPLSLADGDHASPQVDSVGRALVDDALLNAKIPAAASIASGDSATVTSTTIGVIARGVNAARTGLETIQTGVVSIVSTVLGFANVIGYAQFNTTPGTRTNGQWGPLEATAGGLLRCVLPFGTAAMAASNPVTIATDDTVVGPLQAATQAPYQVTLGASATLTAGAAKQFVRITALDTNAANAYINCATGTASATAGDILTPGSSRDYPMSNANLITVFGTNPDKLNVTIF